MDLTSSILLTGAGATALTDAWALIRRRWFGVPVPDWGLVGRWAAHLLRGRLRHDAIARAAAVRGERGLGWAFHYSTGIVFAGLLPLFWGSQWIEEPRLAPALIVGLGSVAAPFLILQPGMGAGVAGSKTPRPAIVRLSSLTTHAVFGLGLFASAWIATLP